MEAQEDTLGLSKPLKLGRTSKIAKITDELLFNPTRGLPQITKNYKRVSKTIRNNDRKLQEKLRKQKSKLAAKQAKVETEVENLGSIIQFYQFWCHGFFPKANFNDCLHLIRTYKSARLKEYRRGLLEHELHKLKVAKGIITEGDEEDQDVEAELEKDDLYVEALDPATKTSEQTANKETLDIEADDGDWDFMNPAKSNGLFVGDDNDDDLDDELPDNPFGDKATSKKNPRIEDFPSEDEIPPEDDILDDHEEELAAMREMGM